MFASIIHKDKRGKIRWAPHQLPGDAGPELHMSHVPWWLLVATVGACAPRTPRTQFGDGCGFNAGPEQIANRNACDLRDCNVYYGGAVSRGEAVFGMC